MRFLAKSVLFVASAGGFVLGQIFIVDELDQKVEYRDRYSGPKSTGMAIYHHLTHIPAMVVYAVMATIALFRLGEV